MPFICFDVLVIKVEDKWGHFTALFSGTNPFDMEASVTDPDGSTELCEIMDEEDFHYRMMFTPQMEGTHTLSIKHKGLHISGTAA